MEQNGMHDKKNTGTGLWKGSGNLQALPFLRPNIKKPTRVAVVNLPVNPS